MAWLSGLRGRRRWLLFLLLFYFFSHRFSANMPIAVFVDWPFVSHLPSLSLGPISSPYRIITALFWVAGTVATLNTRGFYWG